MSNTQECQDDLFAVQGLEVEFNKSREMKEASICQMIPITVCWLTQQLPLHTRLAILLPIYLLSCGRWTLIYHGALHNMSKLSSKEDVWQGSLLGHVLLFKYGKVAHDAHHFFEYCKKLYESLFSDFENDLEEFEIQCEKEIGKYDGDFAMFNAKSEMQRFWRCLFFDIKYTNFYLIRRSKNWKNLDWEKLFVRCLIIVLPFIIALSFPSFIDIETCIIHLVLCRIVMSFVFMAFTTYAHIDGLFNKIFKYYPFQRWIDINLVLEILFGHHIHHVNEHNLHHLRPKRDVSILAKYKMEMKEKIRDFWLDIDMFHHSAPLLPL